MTVTRYCSCSDWRENIAAINGPIVLQQIRSGLHEWCGSILHTEATPPAEVK
jgi:hypothetical protein